MASIPPDRVYQRVVRWTDRLEPTPTEPVGCLVSRYSTGSHGYAQVGWVEDGVKTMTLCHLVVWKIHNGPVPSGMTVDHRCHNRVCVELSHLRLLTNEDNARDNGQIRVNPLVDKVCGQGHQMAITTSGATYCRECMNKNRRARRRAGKKN